MFSRAFAAAGLLCLPPRQDVTEIDESYSPARGALARPDPLEQVGLGGVLAGTGISLVSARKYSSTGWTVLSTSGGSPNQNLEVGSTCVACASRALRLTSACDETSTIALIGGSLEARSSHASSKGDSNPSSRNLACMARILAPDQTV